MFEVTANQLRGIEDRLEGVAIEGGDLESLLQFMEEILARYQFITVSLDRFDGLLGAVGAYNHQPGNGYGGLLAVEDHFMELENRFQAIETRINAIVHHFQGTQEMDSAESRVRVITAHIGAAVMSSPQLRGKRRHGLERMQSNITTYRH